MQLSIIKFVTTAQQLASNHHHHHYHQRHRRHHIVVAIVNVIVIIIDIIILMTLLCGVQGQNANSSALRSRLWPNKQSLLSFRQCITLRTTLKHTYRAEQNPALRFAKIFEHISPLLSKDPEKCEFLLSSNVKSFQVSQTRACANLGQDFGSLN